MDGRLSDDNPLPVNTGLSQPLTNAQLRSSSVSVEAVGELVEAIEAMRMAIVSLSRSIGMAQVSPTTGRMLVDANANATQAGTWNITNLATLGGQAANSAVPSFERNTADNLRRNINVT